MILLCQAALCSTRTLQVPPKLHKYTKDFLEHLDHPYKGVREVMGTTLATIFALGNYVVGTVFIWRMNAALYSKPNRVQVQAKEKSTEKKAKLRRRHGLSESKSKKGNQ